MPFIETTQDAVEWLEAIQAVCNYRIKQRIILMSILAAALVGVLITICIIATTDILAYIIWALLLITYILAVINIFRPECRTYKKIYISADTLIDEHPSMAEMYEFITKCFREDL